MAAGKSQDRRNRFVRLLSLALLVGAGGLGVLGYKQIRDWLFVDYSIPRYAKITASSGANLRAEPSPAGPPILTLKRGTIIQVLGEGDEEAVPGLGSAKWYRIKARSQDLGWCFGKLLSFYAKDKALAEIHHDKAEFEDRLRGLIISAATQKALEQHPASDVIDVRITTPLEEKSDASFDVQASVLTRGKFLGINKHQVDLLLNLDMELDLNLLSRSNLRVRHVNTVSDRQTEGLTVQEVSNLAAHLSTAGFF